MKVEIIKYLSPKGEILEMRKDNFKGRDLPENIIEEYEVEIKGDDSNEIDWLEDLKRKYESGNYILLTPSRFEWVGWVIVEDPIWDCDNYKLILNKHKDTLVEYLKNPSVEIECTNYISKDADMETIWYLEEDFIENYDENIYYRLKVKDLAWYEDKSMVGKLVFNSEFNDFDIFMERNNHIIKCLFSEYDLQYTKDYLRPATESEALNLVYKPQQKISKETLAESDRLKDLFLNNEAECLVENEQEFKLIYDFLDKNCDKNLRRWTPSKDKNGFYDRFPLLILCSEEWDNIFEYNLLKYREVDKPLIKYSNGVFSLLKQGGEI